MAAPKKPKAEKVTPQRAPANEHPLRLEDMPVQDRPVQAVPPKPEPMPVTATAGWTAAQPLPFPNAARTYIGRKGLWTTEPTEALRFHAQADAQAYIALHCEGGLEAVEG